MARRREPDFILPSSEADILRHCKPQAATIGKRLWQSGAVIERGQDEEAVYATVRDGTQRYEPEFDLHFGADCNCAQFSQDEPCPHVVALLYAWVEAPQTFADEWADEDIEEEEWTDADEEGDTVPFGAAMFGITEDVIVDLAGGPTAKRGQQLWQSGGVSERNFDGRILRALVREGVMLHSVSLAGTLNSGACTCGKLGKPDLCAHAVAVLYAWIREPQSFSPRDPAQVAEILRRNPALADVLKKVTGQDYQQALEELAASRPPGSAAPALAAQAVSSENEVEKLLKGWLAGQRVEDLRALAKRHGWKLAGTLKESLVQQVHDHLRYWGLTGNVFDGLTPDQAWLLQYAVTSLGGNGVPTREFFDTALKRGKRDRRNLDESIQALVNAGLLFPCGQGSLHYHLLPYLALTLTLDLKLRPLDARALGRLTASPVPMVITDVLPRLAQAVESAQLSLAPRPAPHPQAARLAWLRDWTQDREEADKAIKASSGLYGRQEAGIPIWLSPDVLDAEAQSTAQAWTGVASDILNWLVDMGLLAGLFAPCPAGEPLGLNGEAWAAFQALEPPQQARSLLKVWLVKVSNQFFDLAWAARRHGNLLVMRTIGYSQQPFTPEHLATELVTLRQFFARLLAGLGKDEWIAWNDLLARIFELRPNTLNFGHTRQIWWLANAQGNRKRYDPHNRNDWDKSVRHVLAALAEGPLQWLGIVELGYEHNALTALRVTPLGRWLLTGQGDAPEIAVAAQTNEPPAWLDAETWRLPPGMGSPDLAAICRVLGRPTGKLFTYRLTNESIERAALAGFAPQAIATQFAEAGLSLPAETAARIERIAERVGRVRLYEGLTLLELADDYALKELLAGTSLKQHLMCQLSPRLAVIQSSAVDALAKELVDKGYTPRIENCQVTIFNDQMTHG